MSSPDASVENFAPDSDCLIVSIGDWKVTIERDEHQQVHVIVQDQLEGSRTFYVLGDESETQKL